MPGTIARRQPPPGQTAIIFPDAHVQRPVQQQQTHIHALSQMVRNSYQQPS